MLKTFENMLSNKNSDCMWIQMSNVLQHSPRSRCLQTRCSICAAIKANKIDSDRSSLVPERLHFIGCWAADKGWVEENFWCQRQWNTMKQWTRLVEFNLHPKTTKKHPKNSEIVPPHGRALKCSNGRHRGWGHERFFDSCFSSWNNRSIMWRIWREWKIFKMLQKYV